MTFEQAAKRLEEIVNELEKGNLPLEEGTKLFEEGVVLVKQCYDAVDKTKGKITTAKEQLDKIINDIEGE